MEKVIDDMLSLYALRGPAIPYGITFIEIIGDMIIRAIEHPEVLRLSFQFHEISVLEVRIFYFCFGSQDLLGIFSCAQDRPIDLTCR